MRRPLGFTLVEVLVALVIVAGIAAAATVSISRGLRAQTLSAARQEARARADAAAERIAADVVNVVRDGDLFHARVLITDGGQGTAARDELLVFSNSSTPLRPGNIQAEGGVYEVQYRVVERPTFADAGRGGAPAGPPTLVLWRRVDPVPDEVPDGGGIVFPVAEGLLSLSIDAFDGTAWQSGWDSDRDGYPHAIRIEVRAVAGGDERRSATSRKIVALDRVPLPYVKVTAEGDGSAQGTSR